MSSNEIRTLLEKTEQFYQKYQDDELRDYMLTLASRLEAFDLMRHHFGYFVMHAQAVVPYNVRPRHFREALERARKILAEDEEGAGEAAPGGD